MEKAQYSLIATPEGLFILTNQESTIKEFLNNPDWLQWKKVKDYILFVDRTAIPHVRKWGLPPKVIKLLRLKSF